MRELYQGKTQEGGERCSLLFNELGDVDSIREVLWNHAGIVRDEWSLREGLRKLKEIEVDERLKLVAKAVIISALKREESRGAHYRKDYPFMRKEFEHSSFFYPNV